MPLQKQQSQRPLPESGGNGLPAHPLRLAGSGDVSTNNNGGGGGGGGSAGGGGGALKLKLFLDHKIFIAGQGRVTGVLELGVASSASLALGSLDLEFTGAEELQSLSHTTTRRLLDRRLTFHSPTHRSNAIDPSQPILNGSYSPLLPGRTRFSFSFALPPESPSTATLGSNARVCYELRAVAGYLDRKKGTSGGGEVEVRTERIEVPVVEDWSDWDRQAGKWKEKVEVMAREGLKGDGEGEGKVEVSGVVEGGRLFWRKGFGEAGNPRVEVKVKIRNRTRKSVSGIKLTLHRRLRILTPPTSASAPTPPLITSTVLSLPFRGTGYECEPGQFTEMTVALELPREDEGGIECWTVRKGTLFELDCFVGVKVECRHFAKDLAINLPIYVAQPLSLPAEARAALARPILPPAILAAVPPASSTYPLARSPSAAAVMQPGQYTYPFNDTQQAQNEFGVPYDHRSPAPQMTMPYHYQQPSPLSHSPSFAASPYSIPPPPSHQQNLYQPDYPVHSATYAPSPQPQYVAFDPNAPDLTPSRLVQSLGGSSPAPQALPPPHGLYGMTRSHTVIGVTDPQPHDSFALPPPPRPISQASYQPLALAVQGSHSFSTAPQPNKMSRAQTFHKFHNQPQAPPSVQSWLNHQPPQPVVATRPPPSPSPAPPQATSLSRSNSYNSQLSISKRTPPPTSPSSGTRLLSPTVPNPTDELLETIGEDGESQAGTARSAVLLAAAKDYFERHTGASTGSGEIQNPTPRSPGRRSSAQDLEDLVEFQAESKKSQERKAVPVAMDIFKQAEKVAESPPAEERVPHQAVESRSPLPKRDEGGLSALEKRLKSPSSPSPMSSLSASPDLAASSPSLGTSLRPRERLTSSPAMSHSTSSSALRAKSLSRAKSERSLVELLRKEEEELAEKHAEQERVKMLLQREEEAAESKRKAKDEIEEAEKRRLAVEQEEERKRAKEKEDRERLAKERLETEKAESERLEKAALDRERQEKEATTRKEMLERERELLVKEQEQRAQMAKKSAQSAPVITTLPTSPQRADPVVPGPSLARSPSKLASVVPMFDIAPIRFAPKPHAIETIVPAGPKAASAKPVKSVAVAVKSDISATASASASPAALAIAESTRPVKKEPTVEELLANESATPVASVGRLAAPKTAGALKSNEDALSKYDVRSARGGRGGVVSSVANLWSGKIVEEQQKQQPSHLTIVPKALKVGSSAPTVLPATSPLSSVQNIQRRPSPAPVPAPQAQPTSPLTSRTRTTSTPSSANPPPVLKRWSSPAPSAAARPFINSTVGKPPVLSRPNSISSSASTAALSAASKASGDAGGIVRSNSVTSGMGVEAGSGAKDTLRPHGKVNGEIAKLIAKYKTEVSSLS